MRRPSTTRPAPGRAPVGITPVDHLPKRGDPGEIIWYDDESGHGPTHYCYDTFAGRNAWLEVGPPMVMHGGYRTSAVGAYQGGPGNTPSTGAKHPVPFASMIVGLAMAWTVTASGTVYLYYDAGASSDSVTVPSGTTSRTMQLALSRDAYDSAGKPDYWLIRTIGFSTAIDDSNPRVYYKRRALKRQGG